MILKFLFSQIDTCGTQFVSKQEVIEALRKNADAVTFFDINLETFVFDLEGLQTSRPGLLNYKQFAHFMRHQREISIENLKQVKQELRQEADFLQQDIIAKAKAQVSQQQQRGNCILTEPELGVLKAVFSKLDEEQDGVIDRRGFLAGMRSDAAASALLQVDAVRIPYVN